MVFGGDCIAKIGGKTVFVPFALPGETLDVEIVERRKDYDTARIVAVRESSPHRTEPFCPHYGACGGCTLQHADPAYQTELRAAMLSDAFRREGISVPQVEVISAGSTGYRARFQLHDGGLMKHRSSSVIPIERCPCATEQINRYLAEVPPEKRPRGRVHVFGADEVTHSPGGTGKVIVAREKEAASPAKKGKPRAQSPGAVSPENECTVSVAGKSVTFDVRGFFQSNMGALSKAIPEVCAGLSGGHALDLYAGCGTFSLFLSDAFGMVTLVEHNRDALLYAERNLSGMRHESFGVRAGEWAAHHAASCVKRNGPFDAVVADPPRSGMEKEVREWLSASGIPRIRSVSCDAATHARDAACLVRAGYRLERLLLLDFYPQTAHVESLAWLTREP